MKLITVVAILLFTTGCAVKKPIQPHNAQVSTGIQENVAASTPAAGDSVPMVGHASPPTAAHKGPGNAVAHEPSQSRKSLKWFLYQPILLSYCDVQNTSGIGPLCLHWAPHVPYACVNDQAGDCTPATK